MCLSFDIETGFPKSTVMKTFTAFNAWIFNPSRTLQNPNINFTRTLFIIMTTNFNFGSVFVPTFVHVTVCKLGLCENVDCISLDHTRNISFFRSEGILRLTIPITMKTTSTKHCSTMPKYLFKSINYMYEFEVTVANIADSLFQYSSTNDFSRRYSFRFCSKITTHSITKSYFKMYFFFNIQSIP